ncbi:MAG: SufD family Fe-S cluster assembly protein [Chloroflexota bacterium]
MTQATTGPMVDAAAIDAAAVTKISEAGGEPDWLRDLRLDWMARADAVDWPTGQEEEWRRTSLETLPRDAELLAASDVIVEREGLDAQLAERGVIFTDLATAAVEHAELLREHLLHEATLPSHAKIWALAHAAWTAGTFCYVPDGVDVDGLLRVRVTQSRADAAFLPLTVIVAGRDSTVTILEEFASPDGQSGWFGGVSELRAMEGSKVRYANLQVLGDAAWNLGTQRVWVGKDANVTSLNGEVGSKTTKLGLDVQMAGKGGASRLLGLLAAGDDQHIDINSLQDLAGSHTTSDLLYLSALYDRAHATVYGMLRVQPEAKATSSYQECRNLLLSPDAGAEPIPALEILTNDILRCGHGATAGAIDPVQLFYAQSRGLDPDEAERMIVRGFFEQVISRIESEPIRARMLDALAPRIGRADIESSPAVAA